MDQRPATTATTMAEAAKMRAIATLPWAAFCLACLFAYALPSLGQEPASSSATASNAASQNTPATGSLVQKPSVFRVKYVSDSTAYIDAGRNADIQEGMKLSVVSEPPDGVINDGVRFRGYTHVAELNVVSVADTSAVCDVVSVNGELQVGQVAFLTPGSADD